MTSLLCRTCVRCLSWRKYRRRLRTLSVKREKRKQRVVELYGFFLLQFLLSEIVGVRQWQSGNLLGFQCVEGDLYQSVEPQICRAFSLSSWQSDELSTCGTGNLMRYQFFGLSICRPGNLTEADKTARLALWRAFNLSTWQSMELETSQAVSEQSICKFYYRSRLHSDELSICKAGILTLAVNFSIRHLSSWQSV